MDAWTPVAFRVDQKEAFDLHKEDAVPLRMRAFTATTPGIEPARCDLIAPTQ